MNNKIIKLGNYYENSRADYMKCRNVDFSTFNGINSLSEIKKFQSNEIIRWIQDTENNIGDAEVIKNENNLSEYEKLNLERILVSYNNRLRKLSVKNIEAQNLINSKVNRRAFLRDMAILTLSIFFSIFYGVVSSEGQMDRIESEIRTQNKISTKEVLEKLDMLSVRLNKLEAVETDIDSLRTNIENLVVGN